MRSRAWGIEVGSQWHDGGDAASDGLGAEEAAGEGDGVEEDGAELGLELVAEPAVDGHAEAHLGAVPDGGGDKVGEGPL